MGEWKIRAGLDASGLESETCEKYLVHKLTHDDGVGVFDDDEKLLEIKSALVKKYKVLPPFHTYFLGLLFFGCLNRTL